MAPSDDPIRLHELRQLAYGELAESAAEALESRVGVDPRAQRRLRSVREEQSSFAPTAAERFSVDVLARLDAEPAPSGWTWPRSVAIGATGLAAVAASLLFVTPSRLPQTRSKGGVEARPATVTPSTDRFRSPTLEMFVKDAAGIRPGTDGMRLSAGDWVQFRYKADGHTHLLVVSIDDDGVIAPLYPDRPGTSVAILPDGWHVLAGSIILDDAVGPERIFALFSDRPLAYAELETAFRAVDDPVTQTRIDVPLDFVDQVSFLIYKEAP